MTSASSACRLSENVRADTILRCRKTGVRAAPQCFDGRMHASLSGAGSAPAGVAQAPRLWPLGQALSNIAPCNIACLHACWRLRAQASDVVEEEGAFVVSADVPGMAREDLQIHVTPDRVLQVRALLDTLRG